MKATKWIAPYKKVKGKNKRIIIPTSKSGAYLIRDRNTKKILYVGKSHTQLQATIYRHFTKWDRPADNPGDFGYKWYRSTANLEVRVIQCSPAQADRLELILITDLRPKDNSAKLKLIFEQQTTTVKEKSYQDYISAQAAIKKADAELEDAPF